MQLNDDNKVTIVGDPPKDATTESGKKLLHSALDILGAVPGASEPADAANCAWYAAEIGQTTKATDEPATAAGKGLTGLDEHPVRRWISWHRWTILAMLAHAFLAAMAVHARLETPSPPGPTALTANEIRHLFTRLHWSHWRRRHQARSQDCHYRRQATQVE